MTKHELKVGDPARITGYEGFNPNCNHMGTEGVITSITPDGFCDLETGKGIIRIGRISDLEPIPSPKDPFAPGEYVTCCCNNGLQNRKCGDTVKVTLMFRNLPEGWFCYEQFDEANAADKAYFRPATPEEIAAYKAKYEIMKNDTAPAATTEGHAEPKRLTFTVSGQEFYVGQRVWNTDPEDGLFDLGTEFEVCGSGALGQNIAVRLINGHIVHSFLARHASTTPPAPHKWKRGDWVRHRTYGKGFVCHVNASGNLMISFDGLASTLFNPLDVDFIGHTEAPE